MLEKSYLFYGFLKKKKRVKGFKDDSISLVVKINLFSSGV